MTRKYPDPLNGGSGRIQPDEADSRTESPHSPPTPTDQISSDFRSTGFRRVPTWIFLRQIQARRTRRERWSMIEAWCALDYDLFRNHELAPQRAYEVQWRRNREWVRRVMGCFREDRDLPAPRVGRRPTPRRAPKLNG